MGLDRYEEGIAYLFHAHMQHLKTGRGIYGATEQACRKQNFDLALFTLRGLHLHSSLHTPIMKRIAKLAQSVSAASPVSILAGLFYANTIRRKWAIS